MMAVGLRQQLHDIQQQQMLLRQRLAAMPQITQALAAQMQAESIDEQQAWFACARTVVYEPVGGTGGAEAAATTSSGKRGAQ